MKSRRKALWQALAVVGAMFLIIGIMVWASAKAAAHPNDAAFIAALDAEGITYPSVEYAVDAAWSTCEALDGGYQLEALISDISEVSYMNVGEAAYFVGAALAAYCPEHIPDGMLEAA